MPYVRQPLRKVSKHSKNSNITLEEAKLIRMIQDQFDRRGGFVRIFPTMETWKKYSKYLGVLSVKVVNQTLIRICRGKQIIILSFLFLQIA